ncbi:MAG: metallophosphoesterase family protein [Acidimicrobiales bacterium]
MAREAFVIAQLSDIHCGSPYFDPHLLETAIKETIAIDPDLVVIGGDLTTDGYAHEFREAEEHLVELGLRGITTVVIPGNHDAKNVGYLHFFDAFGPGDNPAKGDRALRVRGGVVDGRPLDVNVVAIDSTKPDLAEGEIGRERYDWIRARFDGEADVKVFVVHHHLVSVPGTGRERNIVWDSGDVLDLLDHVGVDLVLSGHKHVPHVWLVNGMLLANSGTVSSYRVRGYTRPSYNIIEITPDTIRVTLKYPGTGEHLMGELDRRLMRLHTDRRHLDGMFDKQAWGG